MRAGALREGRCSSQRGLTSSFQYRTLFVERSVFVKRTLYAKEPISMTAATLNQVSDAAEEAPPLDELIEQPSVGLTQKRKWVILALILAAECMDLLDGTIVNVAAPTIRTNLHMSASGLQ